MTTTAAALRARTAPGPGPGTLRVPRPSSGSPCAGTVSVSRSGCSRSPWARSPQRADARPVRHRREAGRGRRHHGQPRRARHDRPAPLPLRLRHRRDARSSNARLHGRPGRPDERPDRHPAHAERGGDRPGRAGALHRRRAPRPAGLRPGGRRRRQHRPRRPRGPGPRLDAHRRHRHRRSTAVRASAHRDRPGLLRHRRRHRAGDRPRARRLRNGARTDRCRLRAASLRRCRQRRPVLAQPDRLDPAHLRLRRQPLVAPAALPGHGRAHGRRRLRAEHPA
ncbi:hypothetical protein SBADM41S_00870 [Streptomyces badius]